MKRTALKDYRNVNKSGIIAVGLKEGDSLLDVTLTDGNDDITLVTSQGMAIRFNETDARLMGRAAAGVKGIELEEGDEVIGVVRVPMVKDADGDPVTADPKTICLLTITEQGLRQAHAHRRVPRAARDGQGAVAVAWRQGSGRHQGRR